MRRKEPRSGVQNIATAEGRGLRLLGQNEAPAGAKDFSGTRVFRPCRGFVFREESFPRPSAVATFWRRFAAENGGILTLRVFKIQFWRRTGSGAGRRSATGRPRERSTRTSCWPRSGSVARNSGDGRGRRIPTGTAARPAPCSG